ncbi:MAG: hypothetical protein Q8R24_01190 [Legionellaceae bacterium]|nr:hypothetical protein [Legionellaceae bacterium]
MPIEKESWKAIHALGVKYNQHLSATKGLPNYLKQKNRILCDIQCAGSTTRIPIILQDPYDIDGALTKGDILKKNRTDPNVWLFEIILIILTFPISVPILVIWSLIMRGTPDFLKTTGAIYVDNILSHCSQVTPESSSDINTSPSLLSNTLTRIHAMQSKPSENENNEQSFSLIDSRPTAELNQSTPFIQASTAAFDQINQGIFAFSMGITDAMRVDKALKEEAGIPIITSYRVNSPTDLQPNTFSMDIKCIFRWTGHRKERATLLFMNAFKAPPNDQGYQRPVLQQKLESNTSSILGYSSWFSKPSSEDVLKNAESLSGIYKKRVDLYLEAHQLAKTEVQRILVLECLINQYANFHEYHENRRRRGWGDYDPGALPEIKKYLTWLPENYQTQTPSANKINDNFQSIFKLLQEQRIDEAWVKFEPHAKLSPFIQHAFPNLQAMKHQLRAIFRISRHDIYYGRNIFGFTWISEVDILWTVINELRKACKLIESYAPDQKEAIEQHMIAPLERLNQIGKQAATETSYEDKRLRRELRIQHNQPILAQCINPTYRILNEDMDDDDEPTVVDVTELSI